MTPEECKAVFEQLSDYIDGELPAGACEEIERHISDCPPCVSFVESLRKSVGAFRNYKPGEQAPPLEEDAKQRLAQAYRDMLSRRAAKAGAQ